MTYALVFKISLLVALLFVPVVVFLNYFDISDCDDKLVHYFSGLYSFASQDHQHQIDTVAYNAIESDPGSKAAKRTIFRLQHTHTYPLTNILVNSLAPQYDYITTIKLSLLLTMVVGLSSIVYLSIKAWNVIDTFVIITLTAFIPKLYLHFDLPTLFYFNMQPFTTYAPRAIASLFLVPAVMALTAGKWRLLVLSLAIPLVFHLESMFMFTALFIAAFVTYKLLSFLLTKLFHVTITNAYLKAISFLVCYTFIIIACRQIIPHVQLPVFNPDSINVLKEIPVRLSGLLSISLIMISVLSIIHVPRYFKASRIPLAVYAGYLLLFLMIAVLGIQHYLFFYKTIFKKDNFSQAQCQSYPQYNLPQDQHQLNITREAELFYNLSRYLEQLKHS